MFQKITLDLVENLSSAKTYIRGEDYYKTGAVRKINGNRKGVIQEKKVDRFKK